MKRTMRIISACIHTDRRVWAKGMCRECFLEKVKASYRRKVGPSSLYFIHAERTGRIKIGVAQNPERDCGSFRQARPTDSRC